MKRVDGVMRACIASWLAFSLWSFGLLVDWFVCWSDRPIVFSSHVRYLRYFRINLTLWNLLEKFLMMDSWVSLYLCFGAFQYHHPSLPLHLHLVSQRIASFGPTLAWITYLPTYLPDYSPTYQPFHLNPLPPNLPTLSPTHHLPSTLHHKISVL